MKITNQNIPGLPGLPAQGGKSKADAAQPASDTDRLELSDRVRELAGLKDQLARLPQVRQEKVEGLRRALRSGAYNPDPAAVAAKLVRQKAVDPITD